MKTWPTWRAGQELKAEHLLGLEDYLLSRSSLVEGVAPGIEFLDRTESVRAELDSGVLHITLADLSGVTPAGRPVLLQGDSVLKKSISVPESEEPFLLDLQLEVNPDTGAEKQVFHLVPVEENQEGNEGENEKRDLLFLGRYEWREERGFRMLQRPPVRQFASLWPLDMDWEEWTQPICGRLEALARTLAEPKGPTTPLQLAFFVEVQSLLAHWPTLPITRLLHRLRLLNWMQLPLEDRPPVADLLQDKAAVWLAESAPDQWPERMGTLLKSASNPQAQQAISRKRLSQDDIQCKWAARFWEVKFLREFPEGTFELFIPKAALPPLRIAIQNQELTHVANIDGTPGDQGTTYPLGELPIDEGSIYRFRFREILPKHLEEATFSFFAKGS